MQEKSNAIGQQIRRIRKSKLQTQEALSEAIGIDPKSLGRIEKGTYFPSLETLSKLAHALEVPVRDFFPESDKVIDEPFTVDSVRHRLVDYIYSADETVLMRWYKETM